MRSRPIMTALLAAAALAGCFPRPDYTEMPDARVIPLQSTSRAVAVADSDRPTPEERAAIAALLVQAAPADGHVRLLPPAGWPRPDPVGLRQLTDRLGIAPGAAVVAGTAPGPDLLVEVITVRARAPACADLVTPNPSPSAGSRPSVAFGCATYGNLAAQVVDPADLAQPHSFAGPDGATSAAAVTRYLNDKVKQPPALGVSRIGTSSGNGGGSGASQ